jgi:hypothetical protein
MSPPIHVLLDGLRCPAPCGERLRVDVLRAMDVRGHAAGFEASLVCTRCWKRQDVADAERAYVARFKMLVAGAMLMALGLSAAYLGARASDSFLQLTAGGTVLLLLGWFGASAVAFARARSRLRRFASLMDASHRRGDGAGLLDVPTAS